uniref:Uncharacterized protein n=1 Tax=Romanomermis culicivorax TaxID=13658 RepID=A0A915J603_ROMCU
QIRKVWIHLRDRFFEADDNFVSEIFQFVDEISGTSFFGFPKASTVFNSLMESRHGFRQQTLVR